MKKIIVISAAVLLTVGSVSLFLLKHDNNTQQSPKAPASTVTQKINYNPPTPAEQAAGNKQKEVIAKNSEASTTPPATANVVLVDAHQYDSTIEVRAFISNVIKEGTCTVTITKGNLKVIRSVVAFKDATTTQCTITRIGRSQFSQAGTWSLNVAYSADGVSGQTSNTNLEIK